MPTELPSRPNLQHLRKLAKDLLHAWSEGDPIALARVEAALPRFAVRRPARLSLAQTVIAREHGFPTWARLKVSVQERLASHAADTRPLLSRTPKEIAAFMIDLASRGEVEALADVAVGRRKIFAVRDELVQQGKLTVLVDALLNGVRHPNPKVRYSCAHAMDIFTDDRCAAPLIELLRDPVPRVRRIAIHSISCDECKIAPLQTSAVESGRDLVEMIVEMATADPSVQVRRHAAVALGHFADERARSMLDTVLVRDPDRTLRRNAVGALRRKRTEGEAIGGW